MTASNGMRRTGTMALAGIACLLVAGCRTVDPVMEQGNTIRFRRVAIVEFSDHSGYGRYGRDFSTALREKLARWTVGTDVIHVPATDLAMTESPTTEGRIPFEAIAEVCRKYRADAMVIGTLDDFHPYTPKLSAHVTLKVVDTANGRLAPYAISRGWDTARISTQKDIESYYRSNFGKGDREFELGPDVFTVAPRYFILYIADRVAQDMARNL